MSHHALAPGHRLDHGAGVRVRVGVGSGRDVTMAEALLATFHAEGRHHRLR